MPYISIRTVTQAKKFLDFGSIKIQALLLSNHCTQARTHARTHTHTVIIMMCTNKCRKITSSIMVQSLLVFVRRVCYRMTLPSPAKRHCIEPGFSRPNATSHFSFHKVFAEVMSSLSSPVPTVLFEEALSWITGTLITIFVKLFEQHCHG